MAGFTSLVLAVVAACGLARAHMVITYPGWRGNNLQINGTHPEDNPAAQAITFGENGTASFPYGMQWVYPCGGLPLSTDPKNRTKWPVGGGALSVQPGWVSDLDGHQHSLFYVNIGINGPNQAPPNYSLPVVPPFQVSGPNNSAYAGQFCLPQVRMPVNASLKVGDNITIQVVQAAQHGAALYSCVDVTLIDPKDMAAHNLTVTPQNCYNSSDLNFNLLFTTADLTSAASTLNTGSASLLLVTTMVAAAFTFIL